MANGVTHSIIGGLSGLAIALSDESDNSAPEHNPLLAIGVGVFFGKLPDILEPALNNPHHRQFCHSVVFLMAVGYGMKKAYDWKPKDNVEALMRGAVLFAGAGYVSHLLLDAMTPRSLPIVGKT